MPITTTFFIPKASKITLISIIIAVLHLYKEKIANTFVSAILNSNGATDGI